MVSVVFGTCAACDPLEVAADGAAIAEYQGFVDSLSERGVEAVPCLKCVAFDDLVGVAAKAYGAGRVDLAACACSKIRSPVCMAFVRSLAVAHR